jgi:demethylmenaquinone methyltransferase/2-methoxy-6-polyprenyl-1,4-benzoquinol methylase
VTAIPGHELQNPESIKHLFASISRRYDLANHLLCGGMDILWRKRAGERVAGWQPESVLDLATGSGDLALSLSKRCPGATIIGSDFCHPMLLEAKRKGLKTLVTADALSLPFPSSTFDAATVAFGLRNMESYPRAIAEMGRVVRSGGHLLVLDFSLPTGLLREPYRYYLHHVLPVIAGFVTGEKAAYAYLGESIEQFPSGEEMTSLINANGFHNARSEPLTFGIVSLYTAER